MPSFYLIVTWSFIGICVGALALAARLKPAGRSHYGWLWLLGSGLGAALSGGLLGFLLVGRLFSTAVALWVAVVMVSLLAKMASCRFSREPFRV